MFISNNIFYFLFTRALGVFLLQSESICVIEQLGVDWSKEFFINLENQQKKIFEQYSSGRNLDETGSLFLRQTINTCCSVLATTHYLKRCSSLEDIQEQARKKQQQLAKTKGTVNYYSTFSFD